jgi:glucokinase-like ROK family protein
MPDNRLESLGADQSLTRKHNSSAILNLLRLNGPRSRAFLAANIGLTRSTVSRIVEGLIAENLVREVELVPGKVGRPGMLLELNPQGGSAIGIEIGVNFISIILTDFSANVLWRERLSLPDGATSQEYLFRAEQIARKASDLAASHHYPQMGIGVGVWGLVDHDRGVIRFAPNLMWRDIPVKEIWEQKFGVPVYLENDANASALGEYYFGAGRNVEDFIYMSMDIGVGGGIISAGKLFRGSSGYAGEIGHMTIDPHGNPCSCGKMGCLETMVGRHVIIKRYQGITGEAEISLEEIIQRARSGDTIARSVFEDIAETLGLGIGNLVNIFNPERIILGWSLGQAFDLLMPTLEKSIWKNSLSEQMGKPELVQFTNGADDCLLGCVALVMDEIIRERVTVRKEGLLSRADAGFKKKQIRPEIDESEFVPGAIIHSSGGVAVW